MFALLASLGEGTKTFFKQEDSRSAKKYTLQVCGTLIKSLVSIFKTWLLGQMHFSTSAGSSSPAHTPSEAWLQTARVLQAWIPQTAAPERLAASQHRTPSMRRRLAQEKLLLFLTVLLSAGENLTLAPVGFQILTLMEMVSK